ARTPACSSARNPAAVVPPGEVTAARNASGPSGDSASNRADPSSVWVASVAAVGRGSPASTPASTSASATRKTYAGPDPDSPAPAPRAPPSPRPPAPPPPSPPSPQAGPPPPAASPGAPAAPPPPTSAGVFGIARTPGAPGASAASSLSIVTPAAID